MKERKKRRRKQEDTTAEEELETGKQTHTLLTRYSFSAQYFLFFKSMLEPCKACLKTNQTRSLSGQHKTQLSHVVFNVASRLIHFCQQFHFLTTNNHTISYTFDPTNYNKLDLNKLVVWWFSWFQKHFSVGSLS